MKETMETLWGGMTLRMEPGVFPLSTDTIALADFVRLRRRAAICDLGCGSGVLELLLCAREETCRVTGVELQQKASALAQENLCCNQLDTRCRIVPGDLRMIRDLLPAGVFTNVVSNPPYFSPDTPSAPAPERAAARSEQTCTLEQLCQAAAWLLQWGGRFTLVYRPERLCDLLCALRGCYLEPKRIRFVRHRPQSPVSLLLLEAVLGGRSGLSYEPDLVLYHNDGTPSDACLKLYHREGDL